ncbi:transcription activator MSS11 isoform X2 [Esox lucius]|nr:transcription activator MSS11 isoform X2 [Esox lucius]
MQELQQLLEQETNSIEEPIELSSNEIYSNETHGRYKRNLDAQPAQQAVCKVRTEVMEITRAMLDRRNANFLLWPPCVEVQRCSGCCNSRLMQCVPSTLQTRYLQVTRIQYIDKRAHYDTAVIPVEDHASCRCQSHTSSAALTRSPPPTPPARLTPKPPSLYKQELHRHDDMKANQRFHLDDREQMERQWQSKYTASHTHTTAGAAARTHTHPATHTQTQPMAQGGLLSDAPLGHGSGYEGGRSGDGGSHTHRRTHTDAHTVAQPDGGDRAAEVQRQQELQQQQRYQQQQYQHQQRPYKQQQQQQYQHQQQQQNLQQNHPYSQEPEPMTQYRHDTLQSDSSGPPDTKHPANRKPEQDSGNTEPAIEKDSVPEATNRDTHKHTEVTNQRQAEKDVIGHRNENDKERHSQKELTSQEQRLSESTNHRHLGSEPTNQGDSAPEEERRKKLLELLQDTDQKQQPYLPSPHLPHQQRHSLHRPSQTQTDTAMQRPVPPTLPLSRAPSRPSSTPSRPPERPFRPALPRGRRRRRKHRGRISKASLRAMIM